jgi:hypothetical protein
MLIQSVAAPTLDFYPRKEQQLFARFSQTWQCTITGRKRRNQIYLLYSLVNERRVMNSDHTCSSSEFYFFTRFLLSFREFFLQVYFFLYVSSFD